MPRPQLRRSNAYYPGLDARSPRTYQSPPLPSRPTILPPDYKPFEPYVDLDRPRYARFDDELGEHLGDEEDPDTDYEQVEELFGQPPAEYSGLLGQDGFGYRYPTTGSLQANLIPTLAQANGLEPVPIQFCHEPGICYVCDEIGYHGPIELGPDDDFHARYGWAAPPSTPDLRHSHGTCWACDTYGFHFDPLDPPVARLRESCRVRKMIATASAESRTKRVSNRKRRRYQIDAGALFADAPAVATDDVKAFEAAERSTARLQDTKDARKPQTGNIEISVPPTSNSGVDAVAGDLEAEVKGDYQRQFFRRDAELKEQQPNEPELSQWLFEHDPNFADSTDLVRASENATVDIVGNEVNSDIHDEILTPPDLPFVEDLYLPGQISTSTSDSLPAWDHSGPRPLPTLQTSNTIAPEGTISPQAPDASSQESLEFVPTESEVFKPFEVPNVLQPVEQTKTLSASDGEPIIDAAFTDSGYGSLEPTQTDKATLPSRPPTFVPVTDVSYGNGPANDDITRQDRDSTEYDLQRVMRSDEDIQSRIGNSHTAEILKAETILLERLSTQEPFLEACRILETDFRCSGLSDSLLIDDITEMLKYYFIDVRNAARSRLEYASANLLRSHFYRGRIALNIVKRVRGEEMQEMDEDEHEDEHEDDESDTKEPMGMSKEDLNLWLLNNPAFANAGRQEKNPNIDEVAFGDTQVREDMSLGDDPSIETDRCLNSYWVDQGHECNAEAEDYRNSDILSEIIDEDDLVGLMENFMFRSTAFNLLVERVHSQTIRPKFLTLRRVLMTIEEEHIVFRESCATRWCDRLFNHIERRSVCEWNWWPLPTPISPIDPQDIRIEWVCHCGCRYHQDVPIDDGRRLRRLIEVRSSVISKDHLCFDRQPAAQRTAHERRSWFLTMRRFLIRWTKSFHRSRAGSKSIQVGDAGDGGPNPGSSSFSYPQFGGHPTIPTQKDQAFNLEDNQATNTAPELELDKTSYAKAKQHCSKDRLRLVFGTEGKQKGSLTMEQLGLNHYMRDGETISCMLASYRALRGFYRYWFSIFKLQTFIFTKFVKQDRRKVYRQRDGTHVPESDPDYEYMSGCMRPPCPERPPIDRSEFMCLLDVCSRSCLLGTFGCHECNKPSTGCGMVPRLPKKKTPWELETDDRSLAWGLECSFEISALRVLLWHIFMAISCFVLWSWLEHLSPKLEGRSTGPLALVIVAISAFWAGAGILKTNHERPDELSRRYGGVQAHSSYIHQGDIIATNFSTGSAASLLIQGSRTS